MSDYANRFSDEPRWLTVPDRWMIHAYYTIPPFAPDGSGRIIAAAADLDAPEPVGEVVVLDADGRVLDRFGRNPVTPSFWHTGFWQCFGPAGRYAYFQSGSLKEPWIVRRELSTGREVRVEGDMEGIPPSGEPGLSCSHSLLYAAGYGTGRYTPEDAVVPFQARDRHGISEVAFEPEPSSRLVLSTAEILERHPQRDLLLKADREVRDRLGPGEGLTLMTYALRWSPKGDRFLFYFGNHNVVAERGEPRIASVFTSDRSLSDLHLAVDLSFGRRGVHWSWHPDNERLVGYGPREDDPATPCLTVVDADGSGERKVSDRGSGHPSAHPVEHELYLNDLSRNPGTVELIDGRTGQAIRSWQLPRVNGESEPPGRNPYRVCHHPVFSPDGTKILANVLPGRHAGLVVIDAS